MFAFESFAVLRHDDHVSIRVENSLLILEHQTVGRYGRRGVSLLAEKIDPNP
jgi:hypothetical protein